MCWRAYTVLYLCVVAAGNIPPPPKVSTVPVNKCCERNELMVDSRCTHVNETDTTVWKPVFTDVHGRDNVQVPFELLIGIPKCYSRQHSGIYHSASGADRLALLPNGHLRHYYFQPEDDQEDPWYGAVNVPLSPEDRYFDYKQGLYCLDKDIQDGNSEAQQLAIVCNPYKAPAWHDTNFLLRRIADPLFHMVSLCCYLMVAVIHFILPQLRDLVGSMITTICVCLAVGQVADTVKIFIEFTNSTSYLIADAILYASLLGVFFWMNSAGYYIWKTFRSRNVFLRITDGRKYCYYSLYVWTCTITMTIVSLFTHLVFDSKDESLQALEDKKNINQNPDGAIGWLGLCVFSTPIAFTILINIYFYTSTLNIIKRMSTYGRIHHKLKYSFITYGKLLVVLTIGWIFLLPSLASQSSMYYCYIFTNLLQGPLVLYICVYSQKRVTFLLKKACCYEKCIFSCCRPKENEVPEWGEESMAMNTR